jgi:hypothetical protein
MARHAQRISIGDDMVRHVSVGALALSYPLKRVRAIIAQCGRQSQRQRDLPAELVAYYVIAMSLLPQLGYQEVLRWMMTGLQWLRGEAEPMRITGKAALSRARARLGEAPLKTMFQQFAPAMTAQADLRGAHWKKHRLVALDGSTLALQDTEANADAFGRPSNQHGPAAYPQARFVALVESGTHLAFAAELGGYDQSELALTTPLLAQLRPGMLCLADRYFANASLWRAAQATGAQLLWRAKTGLKLTREKVLADGSWLARWRPSRGDAAQACTVRVIEYRLRASEQASDPAETYRLVTTLLDPAEASAEELARLYPERWEFELTLRESKGIMRQGQLTLRSKTPELVRQEFWGLLLAHSLVRRMMARAAHHHELDPDALSFKSSLEIIRANLAGPGLAFSP